MEKFLIGAPLSTLALRGSYLPSAIIIRLREGGGAATVAVRAEAAIEERFTGKSFQSRSTFSQLISPN